MKVLITGSTGFIGRNLLNLAMFNADYSEIRTVSRRAMLPDEGRKHKVHISADISMQSEVDWLMSEYQPDIIFHLAGHPIVKVEPTAINRAIDYNVKTTHNLLSAAPKGCKFVLASTVLVYGRAIDYISCSFCSERTTTIPNSVYAISKLMAEELVWLYSRRGDVIGQIARLTANVGCGATHGVLKDFIRKAKSDSEYFEVIGDKPGSRKPYTYVLDTCAALMVLARQNKSGMYNISPNDTLTSEEIANIVQDELGTNKPLKWLGEQANWVGDDKVVTIDGDHYRSQTGCEFQCKTSELAIRRAVRDLHENNIC